MTKRRKLYVVHGTYYVSIPRSFFSGVKPTGYVDIILYRKYKNKILVLVQVEVVPDGVE